MSDNSAIETRSPEQRLHAEYLQLPRDLLGGTMAMRKARERYLRKGAAELLDDYELRLESTFLIDSYPRTLNFLTGQVFKKDVALEDASDSAVEFTDDVDGQGNNISVFCQKVFRDGLNCGVSFVFVDFSRVETRHRTDGGGMEYKLSDGSWEPYTRDAVKKNGFGPRWVHISPAQVISIRAERGKIAHFRYFEEVEVPDKSSRWEKKFSKKIRVLEPGKWEVWGSSENDNGTEWVLESEGSFSIPDVPVAVFRPGEPLSDFTAMPALQGLAELCVEHWQSSSGHRHLMDWVRRPMFFGRLLRSGPDDGEPIPFGPNRLLDANDPSADLKSVGVDPSSVAASSADLDKIESKMALYGLRLLLPRTGGITATQNALESAENDSALKRWAKQFKDAIETALVFTARWLDEKQEAGIRLNDEFVKVFDGQLFGVLLQAEQAQVLPKRLVYDAIRSLLPIQDDVEWEEVKAMIADQERTGEAPLSAQEAARRLLSPSQNSEPPRA